MSKYASESGEIVMTITGESLITRPVSIYTEPEFTQLRELIRSADAAYTHIEMLFHDYEHPPETNELDPSFAVNKTALRAAPSIIKELQWLGLNITSNANNHSWDFGPGGLLTSKRHLDEHGLVNAGAGRNRAEAHAPAFLDTRAGRVGIVACTDCGPAQSRPGDQRRDMIGRPGVMWLRPWAEYSVDVATFETLRLMASRIGNQDSHKQPFFQRFEKDSDSVFHLGGQPMYTPYPVTRYVRGDDFSFRRTADPDDLRAIVRQVDIAKRSADWVILSIHTHEGGVLPEESGGHFVEAAHEAIDAGADIVVGHGPHRDRGIELYQGKPILHSLGYLFHQAETVPLQPQDSYDLAGLGWDSDAVDYYDMRKPVRYDSSIVRARITSDGLKLEVFPIELSNNGRRSTHGRPMLATGEDADRILGEMARMSAALGTEMTIAGDCGVIQL
ncbi:MAG: CapA family protein [Bifidobacteriaceae bacterium]|jgi:poly-gamma-glutamate synthesis protein (capsule biosynthesis protein)|nr:CapA family protein [Bifidobacteriaceae bacterium]